MEEKDPCNFQFEDVALIDLLSVAKLPRRIILLWELRLVPDSSTLFIS